MRMQRLIVMRHTCGWAWDENATCPYALVGRMNWVPRDYAQNHIGLRLCSRVS